FLKSRQTSWWARTVLARCVCDRRNRETVSRQAQISRGFQPTGVRKLRATTTMRSIARVILIALLLAPVGCRRQIGRDDLAAVPGGMQMHPAANPFAYIPAQCYTATKDPRTGAVHNPCYACHLKSTPPNFVDDGDLQLTFKLPGKSTTNAWTNLF